MGDIGLQTAVEPVGDGRFTAMVHADWEIWGPCGGYVAALALRAAGAESHLARPASFFCHYLSVASFAPVDLEVTPLRAGRTVLAQRVAMSQEGRPVLDAMVWSVGEVEGLEHEDVDPPDVPDPESCRPGGSGARRGPSGHALLGQLRPAPARVVGTVAATRAAPADLAPGCAHGPRPPSTIPGWMRRGPSSCSTWGAGPPARARTCTSSRPTSHRAWTSTPRSSTPGSRRTGCCSTPIHRWPTGVVVVDRQGVVTGAPTGRQRGGQAVFRHT